MSSSWLTSASLNYNQYNINPKVQFTTTQCQTPQITGGSHKFKQAVNLTETWVTTSQLTNNLYKTIDLRNISVRCSGISCKSFLNPEGEYVNVPCTSLCFACPDEMFAPRSIKPYPDWTFQQLLDQKKVNYSKIFKICSHTNRDIISDYQPVEFYNEEGKREFFRVLIYHE